MMCGRRWLVAGMLFLLSGRLYASTIARDSILIPETDSARHSSGSIPNESTEIDKCRLGIVAGTGLAGIATIHIYQANGWWKDNRTSFHFQEDLKYGLSVDKLGHFYGASVLTFVFSRSLQWANFPERDALWWGAGASALFQTYVEIEDGFSTWGFDRVDFASDMLGAFYPVAQHYSPFLQNFNFKFSYHPSPLLNEPGGIGFQGQKHILFDDYEGQTIWLSIRVKDLLPQSPAAIWPGWLCLAVGYGARDIISSNPYSVLYLSLDYDMTRLIPGDTAFLKTLGQALNFIHFPAPTIRITPHAIFYGLYF